MEEKSLGAYAKSGTRHRGPHQARRRAARGGLYLLDVVPDGEVRFGFPNINDNAEIVELIACGAHVILFSPAAARSSARPSRRWSRSAPTPRPTAA